MKLLPIALTLSCGILLAGCNRPNAGPPTADQETQERLLEAQQARQMREVHEREAALDERERLLAQREQQSANPTASAQPPAQPVQSTPAPAAIAVPTPPLASIAAPTPPQPSTEASLQAFYDALAHYGSWVQMPGYGYVWQPAAARSVEEPLWRPYTLGHWVFTDQGWAWVSDEPFGWITYHYGRWMRTRTLGWVWTPGDQWAPAWVSWRYGNNFVGWAPLPPEAQFDSATGIKQWADEQYSLSASDYTFVPASEFADENMADNEVPPDQTGPIYDDSNNITNIYYDTAVYAIVCYGPNYEFMRSKSRLPFPPRYTLARTGFRPGGNNGAVISGNALSFAAPRVIRAQGVAAPRAVRGAVADVRLVSHPSPPPAPGTERPPLYQPHQAAPGVARASAQGNPTAATPEEEAQKARDTQVIQQQQAEREVNRQRQEAEAARAAAEHSAAEAALAQRAAGEASAQAARAQAAHQSQPVQPSHAPPPSSVPAGSPAGRQ